MPNYGAGLEQGAAGAAQGAAIGSVIPGVGTLAGAGVGFVAGGLRGLFTKKKKDTKITDPYQADRERLLAGILQQQTTLQGQTAGETTGFRNNLATLREGLGRQSDIDDANVVARGLAGSELDVALAGERNKALASGTRGLLADAERERTGSLARLTSQAGSLMGQGSQTAISTQVANAEIEERRRAERQQQIAGAMKNLVLASYYGGAGSDGGLGIPGSEGNYNQFTSGDRNAIYGTRLGVA